MEEPPQRECNKCEIQIDAGDGESICKPCNSKRATLSMMFGKWPVPAFLSMARPWQTQFWRESKTCCSRAQLECCLVKSVTEARIQIDTTRVGGGFYPVSWYLANGYDAAACKHIEENCESKWDDELQEQTYKKRSPKSSQRTCEKRWRWKLQASSLVA